MRIIILTKNISYEIDLQRELQILSHEVFRRGGMVDRKRQII